MRVLTGIARLVVGGGFIFSGWIKANDPLGFAYKLIEYFEVFGVNYLVPTALPLTILICIFEMMAGFAILIAARLKSALWIALLLIIFSAGLTFYSAYFNKINSGGTFEYVIKLGRWECFTKDAILFVLIIILFIDKDNINTIFGPRLENALLGMALIAAIGFPFYTYNYLPVVDFRPYAIGKNISDQTVGVPDVLSYKYKVKNKKTGEEKIVDKLADDYELYYDFVEPVREVIRKGTEPKINNFLVYNVNGNECTKKIISNPDYNFLLICYDLESTNKDAYGKINDFAALCKQDHVKFVALTASKGEAIQQFKREVNSTIDFYTTDDVTVLRTMIRANPGLMLLKNGTVQGKWHHHSLPSYSDVKQKYFKK